MPQSLARIHLHLVFSTKARAPFLDDEELRRDLHRYLAGICYRLESPPIAVGGPADHVHVSCTLSRRLAVMELVKKLKASSSRWVKSRDRAPAAFAWQAGYGAFSVSPAHLEALVSYIENQEEHHRTVSFQEELRRLLGRYSVEYDERYVWD